VTFVDKRIFEGELAMSDTDLVAPYGVMRELSHERCYAIWQVAKLGGELEDDDARLAQAMRDHPEYYDVWEHLTEFGQAPVELNGVNPLLHVMMHTVVENQAAQNNPPEVRAVLEFKTSRRTSRHQAVHEIANVFAKLLWSVLHDHKPFDSDAYRRKLVKMLPRSKRPNI
jgi:hypothetical protein